MGVRKIIITDIDEVLTIDRTIDEKAIKRIKKMVDSGISVALATANTETRVREAVMPVLEKYELVGKVPIFCEFGLYEVSKSGKIGKISQSVAVKIAWNALATIKPILNKYCQIIKIYFVVIR